MGIEAGELADEYEEARKSTYGARGGTGTGNEVDVQSREEHISEIWRE